MSKLKAHRFITTDELFTEANFGELYYDKSEADNVIAELKKQIELLQKEKKIIRDLYIGERNDCIIWASRAIHNKRKRCLAMARWCASRSVVWGIDNRWDKVTFHDKWKEIWLELAEKFKEAK